MIFLRKRLCVCELLRGRCGSSGPDHALIVQTEDLQERRSLSILPGLALSILHSLTLSILHSLALCSGILYRRTYPRTLRRRTFYPRALHPADPFLEVLRARLCPCVMGGQDVSVLLHEPMRHRSILRNLRRSILHNFCRGILNGLCGPDICLRILPRRPGLELPKQDFG